MYGCRNAVFCQIVVLGCLVFGCSKQEDAIVISESVSQEPGQVVEDSLVHKLEGGNWRALEEEYRESCKGSHGEAQRKELLRLQKRALKVDFGKIEERVRQKWAGKEKSNAPSVNSWTEQMDCNRVLAQAYGCLESMSMDVGRSFWLCGDYSKEMWNVWFDYIEKMEIENKRLKRDHLIYCESAIWQIEHCWIEYFGPSRPQVDKEVDEWLHEKFLQVVGRPLKDK